MRNALISCGCYLAGIVVTIVGVVLLALVSEFFLGDWWGHMFFFLGMFGIFLYLLYDHSRMRVWRYYTGLPGRPQSLLFLFLLVGWPIVVPCYLGLRFSIMAGVAEVRDEYKPWRMEDAQIGPNGLLQPWHGRKLEVLMPLHLH